MPIQVLCSGNLTVERSIADLQNPVWGNDVTIYSAALGAAAAREAFPCRVAEAYEEAWGWLNEFLPEEDPCATAATIILMSRCVDVIDKPDHKYYARLAEGTINQWEKLHTGTSDKYREALPLLRGFKIEGALEVLRETPKETAVITFPPFFAGDYEAMFRRLARLFVWNEPTFELLNEETREELIQRCTEHDEWIVALPIRHSKLESHLKAVTKTTNRGVPINFYASTGTSRVVMPHQKLEALAVPRLGKTEQIEGPLDVIYLTDGQFSTVRSQFMNRHIVPGQPTTAFGVTAGNRFIGAFAISAPGGGQGAKAYRAIREQIGSCVYLLSDFPIAPTQYKRLAKLILVAAQSKEVQAALERDYGKKVDSLLTTAFSDNPVSMKYRSNFKLLSRKEGHEERGRVHHRYMLNYWSSAGQWTLEEGLEMWQEKHAQHLRTFDVEEGEAEA